MALSRSYLRADCPMAETIKGVKSRFGPKIAYSLKTVLSIFSRKSTRQRFANGIVFVTILKSADPRWPSKIGNTAELTFPSKHPTRGASPGSTNQLPNRQISPVATIHRTALVGIASCP